MYLHRATQDPYLLKAGVDIVEAIEHIARTSCGYATVSTTVKIKLHNIDKNMRYVCFIDEASCTVQFCFVVMDCLLLEVC